MPGLGFLCVPAPLRRLHALPRCAARYLSSICSSLLSYRCRSLLSFGQVMLPVASCQPALQRPAGDTSRSSPCSSPSRPSSLLASGSIPAPSRVSASCAASKASIQLSFGVAFASRGANPSACVQGGLLVPHSGCVQRGTQLGYFFPLYRAVRKCFLSS